MIEKIVYTENQNLMWNQLYTKQVELLQDRVYDQFWYLFNELGLPKDRIPQLDEVSLILKNKVGWSIARVETGINFNDYASFLSNKVFPSTTFIRESFEFSKDPDIFHEIFGHCPTLLDEKYSNFLQYVSKTALNSPPLEQELLKRLIWFTAEVGLMQTDDGLKVYGSSLISSPQELVYSIENNKSEKKSFNLLDICRSPYRSDIIQTTYYIINNFDELYNIDLSIAHLSNIIKDASRLKEYPAKFEIENNKYVSVNYF